MTPLTKQERWLMWLSTLVGVAWILYRLLASTGWGLDDEISHYLFSKSVWENSDQLFNHWTRPGRNLLHCLAAPFGFTATRIFTLALAMLSVGVTFKVGRILNVRALWAVPMMLIFQSWFPELSYPVLTQTPLMLFWILGVWLALTKRLHLAGFCFGYLSLIRHEGILLTAAWGLWLTFSDGGFGRQCVLVVKGDAEVKTLVPKIGRDALYGLGTVSAILLYNLAAYLLNDSFPFSVYFESEPTTMYGSGTIYHYFPLLAQGVGAVSLLLFIVGFYNIRKRLGAWSILLVTYPVYFIIHSLIFWKGAFASGGYYHFIMPMAPFVALISAEGLSLIYGNDRALWRKISVAALSGLVVFQGLNMAHHQVCYQNWAGIQHGDAQTDFGLIAKPMRKGELNDKITEASEWALNHYPKGTVIIAKHVTHNFTQEYLMTKEREKIENAPLHRMSVGTVFLWDRLYCDHENRIKYSSFHESQDWKEVKSWKLDYPGDGELARDQYAVIIFEKVSAIDKLDKEYSELGESDKYDKAYD
ncbi:MAG: hypothetical protein ABGY95_02030 [Rubritalea sp.]|uniref:hypothetical protein n=1 Tax=Rubritalea sp. TaxID=2109375 RepID=UPI003242EA3E